MRVRDCDQPWFELQLEYNHNVRCCCYYRDTEDAWDDTDFDLSRFWNGPLMRRKRGIVASDDATGTGCAGCQWLTYSAGPRFTEIEAGINARQRQNWEHALANFEARRLRVDSWPIKYYMNFGLPCNIDCIHCSQTPDRGRDTRQLPADRLLAQKEFLTLANEFAIIGGEPMAVKSTRQFVEAVIRDPDYADVLLTFYTNATLLDRWLDPLQAMRRVGMTVSLDGVGAAYEYIRKGGRWDTVERNVLAFKHLGLEKGLDWRICITGVIMKTSLANLIPFAKWCARHELPVGFVPLMSMTYAGFDTDAEDVFGFPELLDGMPGWESIFDAAIEILGRCPATATGVRALALMKEDLQARHARWRQETHVRRLRARLAGMLRRTAPVPLEELQQAARVLDDLVRAPDIMVAVRSGGFPPALEPLLRLQLERAHEEGKLALAAGLERLHALVTATSPEADAR